MMPLSVVMVIYSYKKAVTKRNEMTTSCKVQRTLART